MSEYNKKETDSQIQRINSGYQWGEGEGRGSIGIGEQEIQTIVHKINCKDLLYNTTVDSQHFIITVTRVKVKVS